MVHVNSNALNLSAEVIPMRCRQTESRPRPSVRHLLRVKHGSKSSFALPSSLIVLTLRTANEALDPYRPAGS